MKDLASRLTSLVAVLGNIELMGPYPVEGEVWEQVAGQFLLQSMKVDSTKNRECHLQYSSAVKKKTSQNPWPRINESINELMNQLIKETFGRPRVRLFSPLLTCGHT